MSSSSTRTLAVLPARALFASAQPARTVLLARAVRTNARAAAVPAPAPVSVWSRNLHAFRPSSPALKKKARASPTAQDEALPEEDELAPEEEDLFGGTTDSELSALAADGTAQSSMAPGADRKAERFAALSKEVRSSLDWDQIDRGQKPSLGRLRFLTHVMTTRAEVEEFLKIAQLYRERVMSSLGPQVGFLFARRASNLGFPEIAFRGLSDRQKYGFDYGVNDLIHVQHALFGKLTKEAAVKPVESSAAPSAEGSAAPAEAESAESGSSAEPSQATKERVALLDQMHIFASMGPALNGGRENPVLISLIVGALVRGFGLGDSTKLDPSSELAQQLYPRADAALDLLITTSEKGLRDPSSVLGPLPLAERSTRWLSISYGSAVAYWAHRFETEGLGRPDGAEVLNTFAESVKAKSKAARGAVKP